MESALNDGSAWERFRALVKAQGGDVSYVDDPSRLPQASSVETVPAPRSGYLREVNASVVGETAVLLGAGRAVKGDPIDHAVGVLVYRKVGDFIEEGEPLFTIHANHNPKLTGYQDVSELVAGARQRMLAAHKWSDDPVEPLPHIYGIIKKDQAGG